MTETDPNPARSLIDNLPAVGEMLGKLMTSDAIPLIESLPVEGGLATVACSAMFHGPKDERPFRVTLTLDRPPSTQPGGDDTDDDGAR